MRENLRIVIVNSVAQYIRDNTGNNESDSTSENISDRTRNKKRKLSK